LTATNYICDTIFNTLWETVLTSWNGDTAGHSWTPLYEDEFSTSPSSLPASSTSKSAPVPPTHTTTPQHHASAGAIAGGVVGGIIGVGAVICVILFICLRKRKQTNPGPNAHHNTNSAVATEYNGPADNGQATETKSQLQPPFSSQTHYSNNQGSSYPPLTQQQFAQQQHTLDPLNSTRTSIVPPYSPQSPPSGSAQMEVRSTPVNFVAMNQEPVQMAESSIIPQVNQEGNRVYEAQG
jgi:hypothetical protein